MHFGNSQFERSFTPFSSFEYCGIKSISLVWRTLRSRRPRLLFTVLGLNSLAYPRRSEEPRRGRPDSFIALEFHGFVHEGFDGSSHAFKSFFGHHLDKMAKNVRLILSRQQGADDTNPGPSWIRDCVWNGDPEKHCNSKNGICKQRWFCSYSQGSCKVGSPIMPVVFLEEQYAYTEECISGGTRRSTDDFSSDREGGSGFEGTYPTGCNFVYGDGSVRFVSYDSDIYAQD